MIIKTQVRYMRTNLTRRVRTRRILVPNLGNAEQLVLQQWKGVTKKFH